MISDTVVLVLAWFAYDNMMPAGPAPTIHTSQVSDSGFILPFPLVAILSCIHSLLRSHRGTHVVGGLGERAKWRAGKGSSQSNVLPDVRMLSNGVQTIQTSQVHQLTFRSIRSYCPSSLVSKASCSHEYAKRQYSVSQSRPGRGVSDRPGQSPTFERSSNFATFTAPGASTHQIQCA